MDDLARWHFYPTITEPCEKGVSWAQKFNTTWVYANWTAAIQHEGLFHSLLCHSAAREAIVTGRSDTVELLYHRGQAIQAVLEGLAGTSSVQANIAS